MVQDELARRIRQMFFRPDDVGNPHEGVIDDDAVIVDGNTVGLDDDEIADLIGIKGHVAADEVVEFQRFILRRHDADDVGTAFF